MTSYSFNDFAVLLAHAFWHSIDLFYYHSLHIFFLFLASIGSCQPLVHKDPPSFYKFDDLNLDDLWVAYPSPETIHESADEATPLTTTEEPMTTTDGPMTTTEEPMTTTEEPMTTTEEPMTTVPINKLISTKTPSTTERNQGKFLTKIQSKIFNFQDF